MERLTERHCGVAVIKDKTRLSEAMENLAKYEEIGVTSEEIVKLCEDNTKTEKRGGTEERRRLNWEERVMNTFLVGE